jgi:hypothetical protein
MQIYYNFRSTESEEKGRSDLMLNFYSVLRSRSREEPHHLVVSGARAVSRCGSGSDGSSANSIKHG